VTPSLLVTDTHPLVWYLTGQANKLPRKVKKAFDNAVEGKSAIFVPAPVLWELSLLIKAGAVRSSVTLDEYVQEHFFANAISMLDLETEDILLSHSLGFSRDPWDVLIAAMTLRVDSPLITADGVMHECNPCELFWD
jgi:PIN domain nuclease of toxin-antitoxin system